MSTESMVTQAALEPCPLCGTEMHDHGHCFSHPRPTKGDCVLRHYSFAKEHRAAWNTRTAAQPEREAVLEGLLTRFGLVLTDDPDFDHDEQTFEKAKASFVAALTTPAPASEREAVLEEGNKRGLYDTTKIGPELVAFLDDRRGMLAALRDEMSEGYRSWLDDAVNALRIATDHFAALTTPAPAVSTDEIVAVLEPLARAAALYRDDTPDGEPANCCNVGDFRAARAILSRIRGEGE